jgi:hypothetical protein
MRLRMIPWLCLVLAPLAAQTEGEPARLVAQLGGEQRAMAHGQLVALGSKAVPALIEGLGAPDKAVCTGTLAVLEEIGAGAAAAVPPLLGAIEIAEIEYLNAMLSTLAELAPFRTIAAPDNPVVGRAREVLALIGEQEPPK